MGWPTWAKANAETVLASPAWRMPVSYDGRDALLLPGGADEPAGGELLLDVAFDDESCTLGLGDAELFPDLHLLWAKREALDQNLLLALAEKECGELFQTLEDALRRQFSVKGFAPPSVLAGKARRFRLAADGAEIPFSLTLTPALTLEFGRLANLDPAHETIRALERSAWPDYGTLLLTDDELAAARPGDFLLLPEHPAAAEWRILPPADEAIHLRGAEDAMVTFAQLADGKLPPAPAMAAVKLVRGARTLAEVEPAAVGLARALRVTKKED